MSPTGGRGQPDVSTRLVRWVAPALMLVLPLAREGLEVDLGAWKTALVLLALVAAVTASRRALGWTPGHLPFLAILGAVAALVSYALAPRRDLAAEMTRVYVTSVAFFLLCAARFDARLLRAGVRAILALVVLVCSVALLQYATVSLRLEHDVLLRLLSPGFRSYFFEEGNTIGPEGVRLASVFFHSNQLGHFLGLSFGFFLPLLLAATTTRDRTTLAVGLTLICACTVLTLSRGTFLVIAIQLAVVVAVLAPGRRARPGLLIPVASVALLAVLALVDNVAPFVERLADPGLSFREYHWRYGASLVPSHYLFGVGPGGSSYEILTRFPLIDPVGPLNSYSVGQSFNPWGSDAHSYYLTALLEGGGFSLVTRVWLYASVLALGLRAFRGARFAVHRKIALAVTLPLATEFLRGTYESYNFLSAAESGSLVAFFMATILFLAHAPPLSDAIRRAPATTESRRL